jgi:hypothetical protein
MGMIGNNQCPAAQQRGAWCMYDMRLLGRYPLEYGTGVVVAGANPDGTRCGSWIDRWSHYIPVPVIEIQPVGGP